MSLVSSGSKFGVLERLLVLNRPFRKTLLISNLFSEEINELTEIMAKKRFFTLVGAYWSLVLWARREDSLTEQRPPER